MYSLPSYGAMIADRVRLEAYAAALERTVRPGCVVADLGAGTGIFSLLACRLGAARVYAVEPDPVIQVAREVAADNGVAERITFLQELSTAVQLPEPADVVVWDVRGVLPPFRGSLAAVADARRRLLRPGGALVGRRDTLWAALVEAPESHAKLVAPADADALGFRLAAARRAAASAWEKARFTPDQLLSAPARWAEIDYHALDGGLAVAGEVELAVERAGTGHGLALWFDADLAEGAGFSNAPAAPPAIYGQGFFPFPAPVALAAGANVRVRLGAHPAGGDYVWSWETHLPGRRFAQSTLAGLLPSLEELRRGAGDAVPVLGEEGEVERAVLGLMDGARTVAEIAREVAARFPGRFPAPADALGRVGRVARAFGR
ncbi:MAG TPA: 50S ribosomal protein L11 methyltransferase [Longimicrobiaceae bacterium]|nr:50S ribosomal protein L11 methyltransferase [Longimicrobiaceae bacterium]